MKCTNKQISSSCDRLNTLTCHSRGKKRGFCKGLFLSLPAGYPLHRMLTEEMRSLCQSQQISSRTSISRICGSGLRPGEGLTHAFAASFASQSAANTRTTLHPDTDLEAIWLRLSFTFVQEEPMRRRSPICFVARSLMLKRNVSSRHVAFGGNGKKQRARVARIEEVPKT